MACEVTEIIRCLTGGVAWLRQHETLVNRMNVFPVPDGDTGTNMLLTLQRALQHVHHASPSTISELFNCLAEGALMGARGNSGTILSYLIRGFALGLPPTSELVPQDLAHAYQRAVSYAYETVSTVLQPVEGTILTVARRCAEAVEHALQAGANSPQVLARSVEMAWTAVQETPQQLARLAEAGVVDSGGMGLAYFLDGIQRALLGQAIELSALEVNPTNSLPMPVSLAPDDEQGYGYDVQFLMLGEGFELAQVRQNIAQMGWSALVDGNERLIKVHVHVHNPAEPIAYAISLGAQLDEVIVENMQRQYLDYLQNRLGTESHLSQPVGGADGIGVIAVSQGLGLGRLMTTYGASRLIDGGQTMNPSTEDFLQALEQIPQQQAILLPNNANVLLAAQQAARMSTKQVRIVPTYSVQQGIAALLAYADGQASQDLEALVPMMQARSESVLSLEVTHATRTGTFGVLEVQEGDIIGLLDGELRVRGDNLSAVVMQLVALALRPEHELLTLYYGDGLTAGEAESLMQSLLQVHPQLSAELIEGKQALYPYLLSLE